MPSRTTRSPGSRNQPRKKENMSAKNEQFTAPDPNATVVVPAAVWEERQRLIRELSALRARAEFDDRNREMAAATASLRALAGLRRIRGDAATEPDEFGSLFPPAGPEDDSIDSEFG